MDAKDEIMKAISEAQEGTLFVNPHGDSVFDPVFKRGFVIRHNYESKDVYNRYQEYLQKYNIRDYSDFPRRFKTKSGVFVRSKAELIIANALTDLNLLFYYEPLLDFGRFFRKPDFYLPQLDLIYEHFGRTDPDYIEKKEKKKQLFAKYSISWIYTESKDESNILEAIKEKIKQERV